MTTPQKKLDEIRDVEEATMIDYIGPPNNREVYHTMIRIRLAQIILRLCTLAEKLMEQRNAFMTDVISWPTGTKTTLKEEIKNYDLELSKILAGEE